MRIAARLGDRVHEVTIDREDGLFVVTVDGVRREVDAHKLDGNFYSLIMEGRSYEVSVEPDGNTYRVRRGAGIAVVNLTDESGRGREERRASAHGPESVTTVMPGRVVRVLVREGEKVEAGQGLVVVEAMKMENEIPAPRPGRVAALHVEPGRDVEAGATLLVIE